MNSAVVGGQASEKGAGKGATPGGARELNLKLLFSKNLQHVANRIHATQNVDEIILEVSGDICRVFNADRLTIYVVSEDKQSIVSKVKTGLNSFRDLKLLINNQSIAGYVAHSRTVVNVKDVYDESELSAIHPDLHFLQEVDKRTGYRTKQMLVAPIVEENESDQSPGALIGVVQIINNKAGHAFGEVEVDGVEELCKTLAIAMRNRKKEEELVTKASAAPTVRTKYDTLILDAVISAEELKLAANSARRKAIDIETVLLQEFQVKRDAIGQALGKFFSVPYEPFRIDRVKPLDLLKTIKRDYVESSEWMPIEESNEGLVVLALDPERIRSSRVVNNIFPKTSKVVFRVTTRDEFRQTMDQFFGDEFTSSSIGTFLSDLEDADHEISIDQSDEASAASDNELVKFVNKIIMDAFQQGASDIHVEPYPGKGKTEIRFRKDGTLVPYIEVPASYRAPLIARLKIMCDLDISEKRKPQDGKIKFKRFGPADIELRVATIPSAGGVEDVVMRILSAGEPIPVEKLGLTLHNLERLKRVVAQPYGLFFVCGPTGSGKTTTLHSVLGYLNTPETKIWTVEDPVEITQKGLRQVQVNRKAGLDFATIMKSFLRADPDIIMVGEMRDKETVAMGIEASLTGHLVFATLHTNSAPESIIRLLDMGMDPFNFADALLGVLAQRLAKRLCECKEAYVPDQAEMKTFLTEYAEELRLTEEWRKDSPGEAKKLYEGWLKEYGKDGKLKLYRTKGCEKCGGSGYKGRVGLHELLVGTDAIKKNVQEHARVSEMFTTAISEGMRTLKMDGMEKVLMGMTDMKQVRAVCIK
ncbi:MAG: GspE/PulE family protein [Burkholderiaceae bacterium]|jgi:type II secretory ATPase GspE/PulE/Tfp pilus assembly ATPase PilB-like protein/GAF domain-containing protein